MQTDQLDEKDPFILSYYWRNRKKLFNKDFFKTIKRVLVFQFIRDINSEYAETINYKYNDSFIIKIIWVHIVVLIIHVLGNSFFKLPAIFPCPTGWRVLNVTEAALLILIGITCLVSVIVLKNRFTNHSLFRIYVTKILCIFTYLCIYTSGGSIEAHFHFFIVIALVSIYADWRLPWIVLGMVMIHYLLVAYFNLNWNYYTFDSIFVLTHGTPVFLTVLATSFLCRNYRFNIIRLNKTKKALVEDLREKEEMGKALKQKEYRYKSLSDYNLIGILEAKLTGEITYANDAFLRIVGYSRKDFKSGKLRWDTLTPVEYKDLDKQIIEDIKKYGEAQPVEKQYIKKNGDRVPILLGVAALDKDHNTVIGFVQDITTQKQGEKALNDSKEYFKALVENSYDMIGLADRNGQIMYLGPSTARVLGFDETDSLLGTTGMHLAHPDDVQHIWDLLNESIQNKDKIVKGEFRVQHKNGSWRLFEAAFRNLFDNPIINAVVINYRDVTEEKKHEQKVHSLAFYDQLTGIPNRTSFNENLERCIKQAKENDSKFAVLFVDLDRFKNINDSLGHLAGDTVLKEVSTRIQSILRSNDVVSRLGGDEFAIILPEIKSEKDPVEVAERLIEKLSSPIVISKKNVFITPSIGISIYPNDTAEKDKLLMYADMAMYSAKRQSGNTFRFYNAELSDVYSKRLELEQNLRYALLRNEFELYYQPKIELKTNHMVGMEALIRWNSKEFGLISPNDFIPVAEETGLIEQIGDWVLYTACEQTKEWHKLGVKLTVSVNVSVKQVKLEFVNTVKKALEQSKLQAKYLELELTEGDLMKNDQTVINVLKDLKALGISISIDDFGTGYSSLSRIGSLPIDALKIDRSFVTTLNYNKNALTIIRTIIAMAKSLNLKIVAEGVESRKQLEFLKLEECDEVQGYFISPPLPVKEFSKFVTDKCLFF